jgi:hypothetical protein
MMPELDNVVVQQLRAIRASLKGMASDCWSWRSAWESWRVNWATSPFESVAWIVASNVSNNASR